MLNTKRWAAALLPALVVLSIAACGSSDTASSTTGPWTFKDDLGTSISLDKAPKRLLVQSSMAAALTDLGLGDEIVGTFGPLKNADGEADAQVAGLDITKAPDVTGGGEFGSIDLEKAAGLKPDLVVTSAYLDDDLWYINDKTATDVEKLAPILVVSFDGKTLPELLDGTERAAKAIGADLDDAPKSHSDFTDAAARVKKAAASLGDRNVLAGSAAQDLFYVSNPKVSPDLSYWKNELGLPLTVPDHPDAGGYFESLSWEKADKYPADVFLYDDRIGEVGLQLFAKEKVFQTLAAAKAEAYVPWTSVAPPSYQAYANLMNQLADDLAKFE